MPEVRTHTISLIIPVLNDEEVLQALLRRVRTFDLAEILIVDTTLPQNTFAQREDGYAHVTRMFGPLGRGGQIAAGIKAARSDYIWVLHADSQPHAQSVHAIRDILDRPHISLGCFHLRFDDRHPLLRIFEWGARFDTRLTSFGDQGFFFRREDLKFGIPKGVMYADKQDMMAGSAFMSLW